jgi:predicted MFS family arabinose efflux permease
MVAPAARRAEGMGYYLTSQSVGSALAPAIGVWLFTNVGANSAFVTAGVCATGAALAAAMTIAPGRPILASNAAPATPMKQTWLGRFLEPSVATPMAILTLIQLNQVTINAYSPLYFRAIGVGGVEWFFILQGVLAVISGALAGRWGDRVGRIKALVIGLSIQCVGLLVLWHFRDLGWLAAAGGIYALGNGASGTALYALAADRAPAARRGAAMATYTMGYQLGSGLGAVIWGFTIERLGYEPLYACALLPMLAAMALGVVQGHQTRGAAATA